MALILNACGAVGDDPRMPSGQGNYPAPGSSTGAQLHPSPVPSECEKVGIPNPAAVYCALMGYSSKIVDTATGQAGICILPDGLECEEWAFLTGRCGAQHSYCAQHGYAIKTVSEGQDPFSSEYAVCTDAAGNLVGTVTDLSGLQCRHP